MMNLVNFNSFESQTETILLKFVNAEAIVRHFGIIVSQGFGAGAVLIKDLPLQYLFCVYLTVYFT